MITTEKGFEEDIKHSFFSHRVVMLNRKRQWLHCLNVIMTALAEMMHRTFNRV